MSMNNYVNKTILLVCIYVYIGMAYQNPSWLVALAPLIVGIPIVAKLRSKINGIVDHHLSTSCYKYLGIRLTMGDVPIFIERPEHID